LTEYQNSPKKSQGRAKAPAKQSRQLLADLLANNLKIAKYKLIH